MKESIIEFVIKNMKKETVLMLSIAVLVGIIAGYGLLKTVDDEYHIDDRHMHEESSERHQMSDNSIMNNSLDDGHMMHMTVGSEQEFLEQMIPHHQEAVDTAKQVLERGGTTEDIRKLANNIVAAQEKEITDMKSWYQEWYGKEYSDAGTYEPMMRDLSQLSGKELDKAFLEDMVMHHMGAIMMAGSLTPQISHNELLSLKNAIESTQSKEIVEMRKMLSEL